jgi:hypothetical protein
MRLCGDQYEMTTVICGRYTNGKGIKGKCRKKERKVSENEQ